jgi:hypothetical protein
MNSLKIIDDEYNAVLKSLMDEKMQYLDEVSFLDNSVHARIERRYNDIQKSLMDEKMQKLEEALTEYCRK